MVTARPPAASPTAVYDAYVGLGAAENGPIKGLKVALQADCLSDHRFWANHLHLLLRLAAYWLLDPLRRWLTGTDAAHYQLDSLLEIAGRVRELPHRVRLHLASSHPGELLWRHLASGYPPW